jgi:hypothetical protein
MWSPRFDKRRPQRRPQRLLEEPPNVTRKMRGLDSGANARSDDREALGFSTLLEPILPSATKCARRNNYEDVQTSGFRTKRQLPCPTIPSPTTKSISKPGHLTTTNGTRPFTARFLALLLKAKLERRSLPPGCQTQHYLQMPVGFAKLSANMATLCANGSASLCGELRGGRELGANMSRSKSTL